MRVVSLLPSATEILCLLHPDCLAPGSPVQLVGRSHECDFPADPRLLALPTLTAARASHHELPSMSAVDAAVRAAVGTGQSLYSLNESALRNLKPDLIITQDQCEVCSIDLAAVRIAASRLNPAPTVLSLNTSTLEGMLDDILLIGEALSLSHPAQRAVVRLRERLYHAEEFVSPFAPRPRTVFIEWPDPIYIGGHWIPQLLERAGADHPLNPTLPVPGAGAAAGPVGQTLRRAGKSIRVPSAIVSALAPEALIISACGVSLSDTLPLVGPLLDTLALPSRPKIAVVDGNHMFSRPGPRLVDAFEFLVGWLNDRPHLIPHDFPWREG